MELLDEIRQVQAEAEELYSQAQVEDALDRMAADITARLGQSHPLILTVLNGGIIFVGQLLTRLRFPLELDSIHATRYQGGTSGGEIHWLVKPSTPLDGRTVLIADDILDEGHTLKAVRDWCEDQGASEVRIAVLCVKNHERRVEGIDADYIALEVPDAYVYGYGMDYHEQGRNLPGIYALEH